MQLRKGNGWGFYFICIFAFAVPMSVIRNDQPNDQDCLLRMNRSIKEGGEIKINLPDSEIIEDLCIWNQTTSKWKHSCYFSRGVCKTLDLDFREDFSIKGNTLILKNASHKASGHYKLQNMSGKCILSLKLTDQKPTSSSPGSGSFSFQLANWSSVTWNCFLATILAIFNCL